MQLKTRKIFFFILCLFLSNCASKKEIDTYKIINLVIKDLKEPFDNEYKLKSVDIVDYSSVINKETVSFIRSYMVKREFITPSHSGDISWTSKNVEFTLNEIDMNYMIDEIAKNERIKWDITKLKIDSLKINFTEFPYMENCKETDKERIRRTDNKKPLFLLSNPIFNSKKNIAIVRNKYVYWQFQNSMIFVKEKKQWKLVGYIY